MRKGLLLLLICSLMLAGCNLVKRSESSTTSPLLSSSSSLPTSSPTVESVDLNITLTKIEQGNSFSPLNRLDYFLSYDSKRDRLLLFGGLKMMGADGIPLKDLWAFDFSTNLWELLSAGDELPSPLLHPHPDSPRSDTKVPPR